MRAGVFFLGIRQTRRGRGGVAVRARGALKRRVDVCLTSASDARRAVDVTSDPAFEERGMGMSMSAGAVGLVKRGEPRPRPLPW